MYLLSNGSRVNKRWTGWTLSLSILSCFHAAVHNTLNHGGGRTSEPTCAKIGLFGFFFATPPPLIYSTDFLTSFSEVGVFPPTASACTSTSALQTDAVASTQHIPLA